MRYVINKSFLEDNIHIVKKETDAVPIIGVVKGDGYGLGIVPFAKILIECGIRFLAVARISEAEALRDAGITEPILLLTPAFSLAEAVKAVALGLTVTVDTTRGARLVDEVSAEHGVKTQAHIKIDTGLGRYGFLPGAEDEIAAMCRETKNLAFTGCYSHFHSSFSQSPAAINEQLEAFHTVVSRLEAAGVDCGMKHIANSSAALKYPKTRLDAVRIGSAFLGRLAIPNTYGLKKIGFMECEISEIKDLPKNHNIGYGDVYRTKKPLRIAIAPMGHIDGFGMEKSRDIYRFRDNLRFLMNDLKAFIGDNRMFCVLNGKRVPLVSRVGLTNIVLDVTGIDCVEGDIAVFDVNPLLVDSGVERFYAD